MLNVLRMCMHAYIYICVCMCVCPTLPVCCACHAFALSRLLLSNECASCVEDSLSADSTCLPLPNMAPNMTKEREEEEEMQVVKDDVSKAESNGEKTATKSDDWSLKADSLAMKQLKTTQDITRKLFRCLQKAIGGTNDAERTVSLKTLHADLFAQKRRLGAEVNMLRDKTVMLQQSECGLKAALAEAREDCRRMHRKLDRLAASGVEIPVGFGTTTRLGRAAEGGVPGTQTAAALKQPDSNATDRRSDERITTSGDGDGSYGAKEIDGNKKAIIQGGSTGVISSPPILMKPGDQDQLLDDKVRAAEMNAKSRLEEISALRQENLELNKELTRVIRMYKEAPGPLQEEKLGGIKQLKTDLNTQKILMQNEREQQLVLQEDVTRLKGQLLAIEESHNQEMEAQRLTWKEHIQNNLKLLETLQMEMDKTSLNLEQAKKNAARTQELQLQINEYEQLIKASQAETKHRREGEGEAVRKGDVKKVDENVGAATDASTAGAASFSSVGGSSDDAAAKKDDALVNNLKAQLEELQSQCTDLSFEVDQTSQAYDSSNEQNARLLEKVSTAEISYSKLQKEITRLRHQLVLVGQERQTIEMKGMEAEQMHAQSIQYVERASRHVKEVEAALKKKDEQLTLYLKQQHEVNQQLLKARVVAEDAASDVATLRTLANTLQARCDKLAEEASAAKASAHRAQEEAAAAVSADEKRRNNKDSRGLSGGGEMNQLRDELNGLKQLLRCNVCSTRQKDCIITKCWHAFCRECIDTNLRNRHRKCPACGKSFGVDDVGELWL